MFSRALTRYCLPGLALQRHNDPSLAAPAFEFDSLSYQAGQQTAATATQGTVFLTQFGTVAVILLYPQWHLPTPSIDVSLST
jgi:hypothetical protein